jgi:aspartate/methionine/tyrosine aminotransferase
VFSPRTPSDLGPNRLTLLRRRLGVIPFDLTVSNPTAAGLDYPASILDALADRRGLAYRPDPAGLFEAREAVALELRTLGRPAPSGSIVLTASTSEAYSFLFKLLCEPGEGVLVPVPSYPLFEHLARLDGVRPVPYRLDPHAAWQPEVGGPEPGVRALVTVSPNNPTGTTVPPRQLSRFCAQHRLGLIADEVFLDYPLEPGPPLSSFAGTRDVLTFTLGGLSKYLGLPQLKLGWIAVSGPQDEVGPALERLEFIADQYLSVATPVQLALPSLFAAGAAVREAILERCRANLVAARRLLGVGGPIELVLPTAGWSVVLRYPNVVSEEDLALELLERDGVAVQPGYFFDFADPGYLAASLVVKPELFRQGLERVLARIGTHLR